MWSSLERYSNIGLFILRLVVGASFAMHGWPKIIGGPAKWLAVGKAVSWFGLHAGYTFFGFMAACSEFVGGICLIVGLFFRPAAVLIALTMIVAANMHLAKGDGIMTASHAIELAAVALALATLGPGRYSVRG